MTGRRDLCGGVPHCSAKMAGLQIFCGSRRAGAKSPRSLCFHKDGAGRSWTKSTMEDADAVGSDDLVNDVMNDRPATIRVFLDFKMGCVGCPIARFHTVDDACREHHVDRDAFLKALKEVVESH